ncbi:hypothetical protein [Roseateles sp.]|uniref:hypothetical protein n=1 Tax=Roseateles sp. TaxID=1971397 RepID=UPI0039ED8068
MYMLYVCRIPVLAALLLFAAGALSDQVQEIARVYFLNAADPHDSEPSGFTLMAIYVLLFILTWTQLFWTHYALVHRYAKPLTSNSTLRVARALFPGLLALLPWVGSIVATFKAKAGLSGDALSIASAFTWALAILGAGSVMTYYSKRRKLSIGFSRLQDGAAAQHRFGQGSWILVSLGLGLAIFICAAASPQELGRLLGAIGVLLAACVALVPLLTWLTSSPRIPRWHWLTLLFVVAALWSALDLNDNHELRQLRKKEPATAKLTSFDEALRDWLVARAPPNSKEPYPVVFVAAEGGGIRAAYFTAQVLAAIQDQCPAFARHLFVISGVSGGSIGAATFAGLLDATPMSDVHADLKCEAQTTAEQGDIAEGAEAVLRADYLGPLVATMLFPDALQRLVPYPVPSWDRAKTLEETLEQRFKKELQTDFMERGLYSYWKADKNVPILMFNATSVETGSRVVASPAYPLEERFHRLTSFQDFAPFTEHRISTMAVTSARFPLVTPAATLTNGDSRLRFVDGGYFENSGATTLSEVVDFAMQMAPAYGFKIRPVVIRIGNSPSMLAATVKVPTTAQAEEQPPRWLGELLSPVRTMVNTRGARGVLAAETLKTDITTMQDNGVPSDYIEFQIGVDSVPIPLGWQLAASTRRALISQLKPPADCGTRTGIVNGCSLKDVIDVIREAEQAAKSR